MCERARVIEREGEGAEKYNPINYTELIIEIIQIILYNYCNSSNNSNKLCPSD